MNFNKVILIGRIANEIDTRTLDESRNTLARFVLAVNRRVRNSSSGVTEMTSFIPVVAWRQNADFVSRYLTKGSLVSVEGYINVSRYTAKTTGSIVERFEVVAEGLESLETRSTNENRRSNTDNRNYSRNSDFGLQRMSGQGQNNSYNNQPTNQSPSQETANDKADFIDPEELIKNVSHTNQEVPELVTNNDEYQNPNLISEDVLSAGPDEEFFDEKVSQIWDRSEGEE